MKKGLTIAFLCLISASAYAGDNDQDYNAGYNNPYAMPSMPTTPFQQGVNDAVDDDAKMQQDARDFYDHKNDSDSSSSTSQYPQ